MLAIYKKELRQYFFSMVGFVFMAFFLAIVGLYTWAGNFANGLGNFELTLGNLTFIYVILIPILTMRIIAEEKRQKTDQLLYTSPVSMGKIVVAKYFAVMTLFTIVILVISLYPLILAQYGRDVRLALAYSSLIGYYLLGAANIAIGVFISAITESQIIAAVVSFIVLLFTNIASSIVSLLPSDSFSQCVIIAVVAIALCIVAYNVMKNIVVSIVLGIVAQAVIWGIYVTHAALYESVITKAAEVISIANRYNDFSLGIIKYDAVVYYISIVLLFVFLTVQTLNKKRYS